MKFLNKLVVMSLALFLSVACLGFYVYNKLTGGTPEKSGTQIGNSASDAAETESNFSSSAGTGSSARQYVLKLEGDLICAYIMEGNGNAVLWNSTGKPLSLSPDDVKKLENGLYTSGFEELCLFFEAYAS